MIRGYRYVNAGQLLEYKADYWDEMLQSSRGEDTTYNSYLPLRFEYGLESRYWKEPRHVDTDIKHTSVVCNFGHPWFMIIEMWTVYVCSMTPLMCV